MSPVKYEGFKRAFLDSLRASGLATIGIAPGEELLDLESGERAFTVYVIPERSDLDTPLHVSVAFSWRWSALQVARTATTEEDLLVELLGRAAARRETEQPWLRVNIELRAGCEMGKAIPMPAPATWAKWSGEAISRLQNAERLVAADVTRSTPQGETAVLAWQGDPEIKLTCTALGELLLESVTIRAFQGIDLPRRWDDPRRAPDDDPTHQLSVMFRRVRAALNAWAEMTGYFGTKS